MKSSMKCYYYPYRRHTCEALDDGEFSYLRHFPYSVTVREDAASRLIERRICDYHFWKTAAVGAEKTIVARGVTDQDSSPQCGTFPSIKSQSHSQGNSRLF